MPTTQHRSEQRSKFPNTAHPAELLPEASHSKESGLLRSDWS